MVDAPLVAACLIVRDEADRLPACLEALRGLADEIVVHDTGSSDGTVATARRLGAIVIEGEWHEDFAAARNTALADCTAEWIVHVDADEIIGGDLDGLRRLLQRTPADVDGYIVAIDNLLDDGTGSSYTSRACRVFRRARGRWEGALHEQVVACGGQPPLHLASAPGTVRITHHGYLHAAMQRGDKINRNIRLARSAVDGAGTAAAPPALLDLGRALKAAGQLEEAATHLLAAAAQAGKGPIGREALGFASSCLLGRGRLDEAEAVATRLRSWSRDPAIADFIDGQVALQRGNATAALTHFAAIDRLVSEDGREWPPGALPLHRALAHSLLEQWPAAAACYADAIDRGASIVAELGALPPPVANLVALQLWSQIGDHPSLLDALAASVTGFEIEEALDWTIRLRDAGVTDPCPLLLWAQSDRQPIGLRIYAAAAATALGDNRGRTHLKALAPQVPEPLVELVSEQLAGIDASLDALFLRARNVRPSRRETISHIR